MRFVLAFIILIHGLIHFIGFAKAFGYADMPQIAKDIAKPAGILWLVTALLFVAAAILLTFNLTPWWMISIVGAVISQLLIFQVWDFARFGTIANVLVLVAALLAYGARHFSQVYQKDVTTNLAGNGTTSVGLLTEADLQHLPAPVKNYLHYTKSVGKPRVQNFKVTFTGQLRQDESKPWMPFESEQYNFLATPTRLFFMKARMKGLPVAGYHRYRNGEAFMDIRLLSLLPVQYQSGREMGVAETVTFFNDMCCMAPATLIDDRIQWLETDGNKVKATFTNNGITVTAWLFFDNAGALVNFVSNDRYALQDDGTLQQLPWSTPMKDYRDINGYRLAGYAEAVYQYPTGPMVYGNFRVMDIAYNNGETD